MKRKQFLSTRQVPNLEILGILDAQGETGGWGTEVQKPLRAHGKRAAGAGFGLEEAMQSARKERGE